MLPVVSLMKWLAQTLSKRAEHLGCIGTLRAHGFFDEEGTATQDGLELFGIPCIFSLRHLVDRRDVDPSVDELLGDFVDHEFDEVLTIVVQSESMAGHDDE